MIAIRMCFLAGRFHATPWGHHVNEGVVEFPPSSWRLLRALTACFYRTLATRAHDEPAAFERLKTIVAALASDAPHFKLPNAAVAHTRHYDQANGGIKFFDTFVAVNPDAEILWFWRDAELNEAEREMLAELLMNLGTFGRAESWCEAELLSDAEAAKIDANELKGLPIVSGEDLRDKETIRLLTPKKVGIDDLIKSLRLDTGEMRSKQKQLEPDQAQWTTYTRPANILTARRAAKRELPEPKMPTVARFALSASVMPLVTGTLPFAESARSEVLKERRKLKGFSEVLTGKTREKTPLENHLHAHYLPTDEDGDGRIDHLTVFARRGFEPADVAALGGLRTVDWRESRNGVELILIGLGEAANFAAGNAAVSLFADSVKFRSVTPFSLPFFATRGAGKPPREKDKPAGQLRRELRSRGLPEPVSIKTTKGFFETASPIADVESEPPRFRWLEFAHRRFNGTSGNGLAGFEIEFDNQDADKISVPLALGFGCHFGLGLFLPVA